MIKIDKKYLPSKKFISALSIAIGVILVAILINFLKPSVSKYNSNKLNTEQEKISAAMEVDSDNDGLEDWKENLYGTDPKNKDSDNDGTSDFDEIAQNRDPLKANTTKEGQEPNDKIDAAIIEQQQKALEEYESLSSIDKFSRNLMSNIIAQSTQSEMDQDTINSITAQALSELPKKSYTGTTKIDDLNLQTVTDKNVNQSMAIYSKNFYIETEKLKNILGNDLNLLNSYIINNDSETKKKVSQVVDKFQNIVDNLIKMPLPVIIGGYDINYHLKIINSLEILIAIDKDILNDQNSLGIFPNLSIYSDTVKDMINALIKADEELKIQR